jgi:DUF1365 family protein
MRSCLYKGQVYHGRLTPAVNRFRYSLFLACLDLDELDTVFQGRWLWSVERPNLASFRRADHLRRPGPLAKAVRDEVGRQLGFTPAGPIRLLTNLRHFGYCFNPISVYYCYGADGASLEAIVAEVHNTPWGEQYLRAFDPRACRRDGGFFLFELDKEFHVSPFMPMDMQYTWRFTAPAEKLGIRMEDIRRGAKVLHVELDLARAPLDGPGLAGALLRWPFMTGKVIAAIYWQALRIKLKGVPYYPHPLEPTVKEGMFHP